MAAIYRLGIVLVAAISLSACATSEGHSADYGLASTPALSDLSGQTWVADGIVSPDRQLVTGSELEMTFTSDSVSANAGCNPMKGPASIDGTDLVVTDLASGRAACEPQLAEQDAWVSEFLISRPRIERDDDDLWLSHDETTIHLIAG